jgi:hypothetical protein
MLDCSRTVSSASARTSQTTVYLKLFVDQLIFGSSSYFTENGMSQLFVDQLFLSLSSYLTENTQLLFVDHQLFLRSNLAPHREHSVVICRSTVSSVSSHTSLRSVSQLLLVDQPFLWIRFVPHREQSCHNYKGLRERRS